MPERLPTSQDPAPSTLSTVIPPTFVEAAPQVTETPGAPTQPQPALQPTPPAAVQSPVQPAVPPAPPIVPPVVSPVVPLAQPVQPPAASAAAEPPAPVTAEPVLLPPPDDPTSLYLFGDPQSDRARLAAQVYVSCQSIRNMAPKLVKNITVNRVLDVGCGDGQLTMFLSTIYPQAEVVGIDFDPIAIQTAQKNLSQPRLHLNPDKIRFVVGDVQDKLPDGPFDLIHVSAVMLHLKRHDLFLKLVMEALRPGGYIWIKDMMPGWRMGVGPNDPNWEKLFGLLNETMGKIGRKLVIGHELGLMLFNAGFTDIIKEEETLRIESMTLEGRVTTSICLGVLFNARKQIAMMHHIPEEDVMQLYEGLSKNADRLRGGLPLIHISGRRPESKPENLPQ